MAANTVKHYQGLAVSGGIAIGVAQVRKTGAIEIPEYAIAKNNLVSERKRLDNAVNLARRQVRRLHNREHALDGVIATELGFMLDAYQMMLKT